MVKFYSMGHSERYTGNKNDSDLNDELITIVFVMENLTRLLTLRDLT